LIIALPTAFPQITQIEGSYGLIFQATLHFHFISLILAFYMSDNVICENAVASAMV